MKEKYIEYANKTFEGKAKDIVLKQIDLFYKDVKIKKPKYQIGDEVILKKGTFLHGLGLNPNALDFIVENGFISSDFNNSEYRKKIFNSVGMWNIKNDCLLKDYIYFYSGATFTINLGTKGRENNIEYKVIPLNKIEKSILELNNRKDVWSWSAMQTKEVRFLPSKASDKIQLGFILNMESDYAKELAQADFFNKEYGKEILKYFCVEQFLNWYINNEINPTTTDRESSIMFGLPSSLIEGVLVGRQYEQNEKILRHIKEKLTDCYICNLDGKVIY
ncbi:MAG: hypothetical protein IKJ43_02995 [Bacilli bacterium]|nr:hypothetical protein [Bacilli bacterium]